jgi:hypothetical protein
MPGPFVNGVLIQERVILAAIVLIAASGNKWIAILVIWGCDGDSAFCACRSIWRVFGSAQSANVQERMRF